MVLGSLRRCCPYRCKVWMSHGFLSSHAFLSWDISTSVRTQYYWVAYLVIISEQLVQKVDCIITHKPLVLRVDKAVPVLSWESSEDIVILSIELYIVPVEVFKKVIRTQHFRDFDELIRVAIAVKEGLLAEDH